MFLSLSRGSDSFRSLLKINGLGKILRLLLGIEVIMNILHRIVNDLIDIIGEFLRHGGEKRLMSYIFPSADEWYEWAAIYYELQEEGWDAAARIYDSEELTRTMVEDLNPERDYDSIIDECEVNGLL